MFLVSAVSLSSKRLGLCSTLTFRHRNLSTDLGGLSARWCVDNIYGNPASELQELLQIPLFSANETAFNPSEREIFEADASFKRLDVTQTLRKIVDADQLPVTNVPEVCFVGQSNVGKSSLIKALFGRSEKVKIVVSKTPGRTTSLNLYQLGKKLTLVDMPGYGENMPEHYVQSVENYVKTRKNLVRTFLLLDGSAGLTPVDKIGIEMMEEFGKSYVVIVTKIDRGTHHTILRNLMNIQRYRDDKMLRALPQMFLLSSQQGSGLPLLRSFVMYVTGNFQFQGL